MRRHSLSYRTEDPLLVDRSHGRRLTRKQRSRRVARGAVGAAALVAVVGGSCLWALGETAGIIAAVAAGTGCVVSITLRESGFLRIEAAESSALAALQPLREGDVYPLNPATLAPENALLLSEIIYRKPTRVLELGSGSSTLMIARCLKLLGGDRRLISVEHHPEWLRDTRNKIAHAGLEDRVHFIHAPLGEHEGFPAPWYELELSEDAGPFDLVLVDGPEGGSRDPLARYGAFPFLRSRLAPGAVLLVDDALRGGETEIVERWKRECPELDVKLIGTKNGLWRLELPG
jgi:predicted O-methyltransferase YrrM